MRVRLCAVGRARRAPEAALVQDYLDRASRAGRGLGLGPFDLHEVEDRSNAGPAAEAALLARGIGPAARLCALDERGRMLDSPGLARQLAGWRDDGTPEAAFVIGGADGLAPGLRERADLVLSFGPMVWPHLLARAMLAEQLYRAVTILSGSPYHRA